jgi:hypothetical protein
MKIDANDANNANNANDTMETVQYFEIWPESVVAKRLRDIQMAVSIRGACVLSVYRQKLDTFIRQHADNIIKIKKINKLHFCGHGGSASYEYCTIILMKHDTPVKFGRTILHTANDLH